MNAGITIIFSAVLVYLLIGVAFASAMFDGDMFEASAAFIILFWAPILAVLVIAFVSLYIPYCIFRKMFRRNI